MSSSSAPATPPAVIAPAPDGTLGAWLVAGTFDRDRLPDEVALSPSLDEPLAEPGAPARWKLATGTSGASGPVDLLAALGPQTHDRLGYAGGVLHLEHGGYCTFLFGADDGAALFVDGRRVAARDEPRTRRDDEDMAGLDLPAGDHAVVLALLHRAGAWGFRLRVLDAELEPPAQARWILPGTTSADAQVMAAHMSLFSFDRGSGAEGYRGSVTVRFPGGAPFGVPLGVRARLSPAGLSAPPSPCIFDVDAGQVAVGDRGVGPLTVVLPAVAAEEVEDNDFTLHVEAAGRDLDMPFHPRKAVREAVARCRRALDAAWPGRSTGTAPPAWLDATSAQTVEYVAERLTGFVARGDGDVEAMADDARELDDLSSSLEQQRDPYIGSPPRTDGPALRWRTGAMRRAYRSPIDGQMSEMAVYVPPDFDPERSYPLIVALHGMNGHPLEMIMWLFGHDDPARTGDWEDRHPRRDLPALEAIIVAPSGHANTMYRELGEDDVMQALRWAMVTYPIDPSRVTITGPSMGGIGSAACALHYPAMFAGAEPLCGYHSYFVRGDIAGRGMRPWEKHIAEMRSNVFWAENGMYLPLYVVHGTKDLPEENSSVLIDRYDELHYAVKHEHPDLGHNVWQSTYEDLKGARWLLGRRRPVHPRAVRFKTASTRYPDDAWVHVRELRAPGTWGEVIARIDDGNVIYASTTGVAALGLERDTERIDDAAPVSLVVDGSHLTFQAGEPIELHREGPGAPGAPGTPVTPGAWHAGAAPHEGPFKHGRVTGPLRDVFHEPLVVVWGASDPSQARANEEVARAWARVHLGVHVSYPIMSDDEFFSSGESIANDRALFLVGNAASNRVVRELEPRLPIRIEGAEIVVGDKRISSPGGARSQLGAAFIRPNPLRPDRYVVVVEGVGALGTWRSLSLPDMLPDYVVYDEGVEPAHAQLLLGLGSLRTGGYFDENWAVPR
jgi:predicted esterase